MSLKYFSASIDKLTKIKDMQDNHLLNAISKVRNKSFDYRFNNKEVVNQLLIEALDRELLSKDEFDDLVIINAMVER